MQTTRERQLLALVLRLQWLLRDAAIASIVEKPMSDIETRDGFCRPRSFLRHSTAPITTNGLMFCACSRALTGTDQLLVNARLRAIGNVIEIAAEAIDDPERLSRDLLARGSDETFANADWPTATVSPDQSSTCQGSSATAARG